MLAGLLFSCKSKQKAFSPSSFKAIEQGVIEGDALIIEANKEKNRENFDKAIHLYELALSKQGNKAAVYYELAQLAYNYEHNYAKALGYINQALDIDEKNKWYLYFYLQINEENGRPQLVEKGYQKLIHLFPENTQYQSELADYYISRKAYDKAMKVYDSIEKRIGPQASINRNKFLIHRGKKRYQEAISELEKLIALDPADGEYYSDLVDIL